MDWHLKIGQWEKNLSIWKGRLKERGQWPIWYSRCCQQNKQPNTDSLPGFQQENIRAVINVKGPIQWAMMENTTLSLILHPKKPSGTTTTAKSSKTTKKPTKKPSYTTKKPLTTSESTMSPLEPTEDEPFFPDE